jgi:shikimate dehydrogenase
MKKYLVIGNPIDHSLSPKLHNKWFKTTGIEAIYEKKKIVEEDLEEIINKIKNETIDGINVTVPFKKLVIPFLDELTPEANEVQSVNTILKKNNKVIGANTDIHGFEASLHYNNFKLKNKKIFILGAGGVVSSIIYVLKKIGVAKITISNRTKKKIEGLTKIYPDLEVIDWGQNTEFDMIINATSLGLGEKDKIGLDFKDLKYTNPKKTYKSENDKKRITNSSKLFYDAIYMQGDKETDFLSTGKKLGHETMDGSLMFLHQAAESFRIWHETEPRTDWDGKAQIEDLQDLKLYYLL